MDVEYPTGWKVQIQPTSKVQKTACVTEDK